MFIGEVEQFWLIAKHDEEFLATSKKEAILKAKQIVMDEYGLVNDAEIRFLDSSVNECTENLLKDCPRFNEKLRLTVGDLDTEEWEFSGIQIKPIDLA